MLTIVSGGQTGVDRAALDVAIEQGIPYRGWCPKGGWAEDRPSPPGVLALYAGLRETPEADPRQRTEWNVRDSDRLMVLVDRANLPVSKGTAFALACAKTLAKPHIVIDIDASDVTDLAADFLGALGGVHRRPARKRGSRHLCQSEGIFEPPAGAPNLRGRSPAAL
jgi:hypothetical protein